MTTSFGSGDSEAQHDVSGSGFTPNVDGVRAADIDRLRLAVPAELQQIRQWVVFKLGPPKTDGKRDKRPFYPGAGIMRNGTQGSAEDRAQLGTFDEALVTLASGRYDGVGLAMLPEAGLVGIDLDHCLDEQRAPRELAAEILSGCDTYAEISPSGKGLRLFFRGALPDKKNHGAGVELFHGSGFLTVTGNRINDADIEDLPDTLKGRLLELAGGTESNKKPRDWTADALPGQRRDTLNALVWRHFCEPNPLPLHEIWQRFATYNATHCDPAHREDELKRIWDQALKDFEKKQPEAYRRLVQRSLRLKRNRRGQPLPTLENVVIVLTEHDAWRGKIYFDEFHGRSYTTASVGPPQEWSDRDDIGVAVWLQSVIGIDRVSVATVADAVRHVATLDRRDEVATYLESLQWDGEARLQTLIARGFGATQNDYNAQVGANLLIGMVARALRPGCKLDTMPVFEGAQGIFKSTALAILGGKWFAEVHQAIDSKDFYLALSGKLLLEISEMHSFTKAEVERLKGVMSCQVDRYRAPYERRAVDHPRRCVFAGTTNRDDWNRDETGARRFWPVVCGHIDLGWLSGHRDQLLAEAVHKFKQGATWWEVPREHAEREQDARRVEDPWQSIIADWLISRTETTTNEILSRCIMVGRDRMTKADEMRVGAILHHLGWQKAFRGGARNRARYWVRGE